jgi:glucoamylase
LVRFGLRRADDPLVLDSIRVADELLEVDTPSGRCWHRYNGDGYGEHDDGSAFDGSGRGRAWPLLTGERGHYELAAGSDPLPYLVAMAAMCGEGGMMPEQVWDTDALPAHGLYPGRPSGSAMPLVWAHAEFIKLLASRHLGYACDRPQATWQRYRGQRPHRFTHVWLPQAPLATLPRGSRLLIAVGAPAVIHVGRDGWQDPTDAATQDSGLGLHYAEIETHALQAGQRVDFTVRDVATGRWIGEDYTVSVEQHANTGAIPTTADPAYPAARRPGRHDWVARQ